MMMIDRHEETRTSLPATGSPPLPFTLFDLRLHLGQRRLWVGPALASLCGALATGLVGLNSASAVSLVLLLFLVDPLLGAVWTFLASPNNLPLTALAEQDDPTLRLRALPYTVPGSLGDRAHRWLNRLVSETGFAAVVSAIGGKVLFAAGIAVVLGPGVALVVAAAFGWVVFWTRVAGRPHSAGARAVYALGLPWLLGYATFLSGSLMPLAPQIPSPVPSFLSSGWILPALPAVAYTIVWWSLWREESLTAANLIQLLLVALLFARKEPFLAVVVAFALIFQMALQPHRSTRGHAWYLRHSQWFLLLSMVTVALGVTPR